MLVPVEETGKNQLVTGWKVRGMLPMLSRCWLRNLWQIGVLEHCRYVKTNCQFSIFRGVSFWWLPKATKNINVYFFIHSRHYCRLYQRVPVKFWSYYAYYFVFQVSVLAFVPPSSNKISNRYPSYTFKMCVELLHIRWNGKVIDFLHALLLLLLLLFLLLLLLHPTQQLNYFILSTTLLQNFSFNVFTLFECHGV